MQQVAHLLADLEETAYLQVRCNVQMKEAINWKKILSSPKGEGVKIIEWIPQETQNIEDFIVPPKMYKSPQIAWAAMAKTSEEKNLRNCQASGMTGKPKSLGTKAYKGD